MNEGGDAGDGGQGMISDEVLVEAFTMAFRALLENPNEDSVTLFFPRDGPAEWCVTARRGPGAFPCALYMPLVPVQYGAFWLADEDASRIWDRVQVSAGVVGR